MVRNWRRGWQGCVRNLGVEVEFQRALWTLLNANKATIGAVSVSDVARQVADGGNRSLFPYLTIGSIFVVQSDTQTTEGYAITSRIHTWSRSGSMLECKTIQGEVYDLLHRTPLTVTGFNNFVLLRQETDCIQEEDGKMHGICEYRGLVENSA